MGASRLVLVGCEGYSQYAKKMIDIKAPCRKDNIERFVGVRLRCELLMRVFGVMYRYVNESDEFTSDEMLKGEDPKVIQDMVNHIRKTGNFPNHFEAGFKSAMRERIGLR